MPFLLPDDGNVGNCAITFNIPDDPKWVSTVIGAIARLAVATEWEAGSGGLTVDEAIVTALEIRESVAFSNECNKSSITIVLRLATVADNCTYLNTFYANQFVIIDTVPTSAGFPAVAFTDVNGQAVFPDLLPATYQITTPFQVSSFEVVRTNDFGGCNSTFPANQINIEINAGDNKEVTFGYRF